MPGTARLQNLLSKRVPKDAEHARYCPNLEEDIKECLWCLRRNAMMFDLEVDPDLIEQQRQMCLRDRVNHIDIILISSRSLLG